MRTPIEVHDDPQTATNGYVAEIERADGTRFHVAGAPVQFDQTIARMEPAPELGQHTEEVLLEAGWTWDDLGRLKDAGVIV
jgi:crotonobetainyl-CoA:carnitine CoA-transferase CaiB-like acyl-CoA transferase